MGKNFSTKLLTGLAIACAILSSLGGCSLKAQPKYKPLSVTLLKVGKADAIIALSNSHALLIDVGEDEDGKKVVEFLQENNIAQVDVMIITHFDQDHVGGADTVLEECSVNTIYVPDYEGSHSEYQEFLTAAHSANVPLTRLSQPTSFQFGDSEVLIEPPASYDIPDHSVDFDNDFSLITTIQHGENRFVFMGDAEKKRIRQWLADSHPENCDFLKVPHHGIYNKALNELFETLEPQYAAICSSKKNPADVKTLELLKLHCPNIFETKDGVIALTSNGTTLEVQQKTFP